MKIKRIEKPHVVILGAGASKAAFPNGEKNGVIFPLMNNLIEILNLEKDIKKYKVEYKGYDFEELYSNISNNSELNNLKEIIENKIYSYFSRMIIPDTPTIYDYLVLSLRKKDLIASFNWDPLLLQSLRRNLKITKNLPEVVFLHGNVGMGFCEKDLIIDFIDRKCPECNEKYKPVKLLYPIEKKNYNENLLIKDQWDRLRSYLEETYFLTIYGYSAPDSDVEAKNIIKVIWENNKINRIAQVEIIDIKEPKEIQANWRIFTGDYHYGIYDSIWKSFIFRFPRKSCEALFQATMQNDPIEENPIKEFSNFKETYKFFIPIINEEQSFK